jgi:hypothetical protein
LKDFGRIPPAIELPLQLCQGHCDDDSDCAVGLMCFQRDGFTPVSGCFGNGISGYDYCISPELKDFGATPPASQLPLQLCEGDCDDDSDCAGGLECFFQRDDYAPVPGCSGRGISFYNYCIYPELKDLFGLIPPAIELPLQLCQGHCYFDSDCAGGLKCFQRDGFTTVSGCSGNGISGHDYCISPELKDFGAAPPASQLPLQLCQGDCDDDSDCAVGLKCFQRDGFTPVSGCFGNGISDYDYCIGR